MKKAISVLPQLLLASTALYPAGVCIAAVCGYRVTLLQPIAFPVILAVLSAGAVSADILCGGALNGVAAALTAPLSLLYAALCFFTHPQPTVAVAAAVTVGCSLYMTLRRGRPAALRLASLVLLVLLLLPIGFWGFLTTVFGGIAQSTVVRTLESPDGSYCAQLIDSDQGALGGDTLVEVVSNKRITLPFFEIRKKPQRVYRGEWGAYKSMDIYWRNAHCLVIDGVPYPIT